MKKWEKNEITYLINNYNIVTIETICFKLNRSEKSIRHKLSRLGITKRFWDKEKINYLTLNYKQGVKKISEKLGVNKNIIYSKAYSLKLSINNTSKNDKLQIDSYKTKEGAYILGLLWADGYIQKKKNSVFLTIIETDANEIKKIFERDTWSFSLITRKEKNYKNMIYFYITSKIFHDFLVANDFSFKSEESPDKIIKYLGNDLTKYFILGLIDGDGCFYYNKKHYIRQFTITSSFQQNWDAIIKIFDYLSIKYKIIRIKKINNKTKKENSYSQILITGKNIITFGDYIYNNETNLGLIRKKNKFNLIKKSYVHN